MRAFVTALFLALSAPELNLRARAARLGRVQIVLVEKVRAVRQRIERFRRARFRWETAAEPESPAARRRRRG